MNVSQFKQYVVRPTLNRLPLQLCSASAVNGMTGIALVESQCGEYVQQIGGGPALGPFQMEPTTHDDCWNTFLAYPRNNYLRIPIDKLVPTELDADLLFQLQVNFAYACAMARVKIYRAPDPLPNADDAAGWAAYHKKCYNTAGGATNTMASELLFQQAISA